MKLEKYEPCAKLRPFIKDYLIIESDSAVTNTILPGTSLTMAFRFKGKTFSGNLTIDDLPAFCITGLTKTARTIQYLNNTAVLVVHFKDGGAPSFFKYPLHELSGFSMPLEQLYSREQLCELEDQLGASATNRERIAIVETFLIANLRHEPTDKMAMQALELITSANGAVRIGQLATFLNTNINSLEKKFRSQIGISPKHFSSILRLTTVIKNYRPGQELTALSHEAGFFDQSHFIKHFKLFTGDNPHRFFKNGIYWQI